MNFKQSIAENWVGMLLMAGSALMVSIGQLLWKCSGGTDLWFLAGGFLLYGLGALLMVVSFKHGKLSVVHPVQSLAYVFGLAIGYFSLGERLRLAQYVAIVLIMSGVVLIGGGNRE